MSFLNSRKVTPCVLVIFLFIFALASTTVAATDSIIYSSSRFDPLSAIIQFVNLVLVIGLVIGLIYLINFLKRLHKRVKHLENLLKETDD